MSFVPNFIGNNTVIESLANDIQSNNISQGYLFFGPDHIGKRTLAKALALHVLQIGANEQNREIIAREVEKLTHSDYIILDELYMHEVQTDWDYIQQFSNAPQQHRKQHKTKSNTISIDDIRALQDILYETPAGAYKICIITDIHRLHTAAANALLKILEEPPPHLIFILTAEEKNSVLPTIISRSRVLSLYKVPSAEIKPHLQNTDEDTRQFILHIAAGKPGKALQLLHNSEAFTAEKAMHTVAREFWQTSSRAERMKILLPIINDDANAKNLLYHIGITLQEQAHSTKQMEEYILLCSQLQTNVYRPLLVHNFIDTVSV